MLQAKRITSRYYSSLASSMKSIPKSSPYIKALSPDSKVPHVADITEKLCKVPRQLETGFYTYTYPTTRKSVRFLDASSNALNDLGLAADEATSDYFRDIVSGKKYYHSEEDGVHPFSMAYAGFQFGSFAGQLGDGRVVNLFKAGGYELQLKGAGKTPFSRFADGNAVLRSSIREYIISESLNAIGIPSTRALALSAYPENKAMRSYPEMCAVVCRMSPSWIRIGHFDYCRMKGDRKALFELSDYLIENDMSDSSELLDYIKDDEALQKLDLTRYDLLFLDIVFRNANSVAYWHAYGFLNGVLNTDNTSVLGLAMDFGPFAIMDKFDPNFTSNSEDHTLRYSFKNTPSAIWFNMVKLAESMAEVLGGGKELVDDEQFRHDGFPNDESIELAMKRVNELIKGAGDLFERVFIEKYLKLVCSRLGITPKETDNNSILSILFETLQITKIDYNNFFIILQNLKIRDDSAFDVQTAAMKFIPEHLLNDEDWKKIIVREVSSFLTVFRARLEEEQVTDMTRNERASNFNPLFVPRSWILDEVIEYTTEKLNDKCDNDEEVSAYIHKVMKMAQNPYNKDQWGDDLVELQNRWTSDVTNDKTMLTCSCSS